MKVRKGTIKKPKFLVSYIVSVVILLIVFFVLFSIPLLSFWTAYNFEADSAVSEEKDYLDDKIYATLNEKDLTQSDLAQIKFYVADHYSYTGSKCKVNVDGYGEIDSSKTAIMFYTYWTDSNDLDSLHTKTLMLADNKYLEYFNTSQVRAHEVSRIGDTEYFYASTEIEFSCNEFYADLEKGLFIPVEVEICNHGNLTTFNPTGLIIRIDPENTDGYTLYKSVNYHTDFYENPTSSVNYGVVLGNEGAVTDEECEEIHGEYETETGNRFSYRISPVNYIPFSTAYKNRILTAVVIIIWLAFAFAFIPASISYNIKLRRFKIFEYRSKMIDAMAHDLKTPMAAITAYAENLSNHIGTEKQEYYAGKVEEKVAQMNKMVNDILEFSKSENKPAEITKENVDLSEVIGKIIADNEHTISERSLKINYDKKSVTVKTDEKIFEQAISNLINNAVRYCKEGTEIGIACEDKKLVITNITEGKIDDVKSLKNPFTKGDSARKNNGTGLGLAIADNNLAMLGFKLGISAEDDRFIATVKL